MKLLQCPTLGNGGRLGNQLFGVAATIGLALRHGYTPRLPEDWAYRSQFNIPNEYFGPMLPGQGVREQCYQYDCSIAATLALNQFEVVTIVGSYLQSPQYWQGYEQQIIACLTPTCLTSRIEGVAIHYRRGDYIGNSNYIQLNVGYYAGVYNWLDTSMPITAFSDDLEFLKLHHPNDHYHVDEIADLRHMMRHTNHIISNSTFAWWGAYLSGGCVFAPLDWFAGRLAQRCNTNTIYPKWFERIPVDTKCDLRDFTFIIPVSYDHQDRIENLTVVKKYLRTHFNTNILVGEINTNQMEADCQFDYDGKFHRTKAINELTRLATTKFVVNLDADILVPVWQLLKMAHRLRAGADMVYPYSGWFAGVDRAHFPSIASDMQLSGLAGKRWRGQGMDSFRSVGGVVGYNVDRFFFFGGENEKFISYNPEDQERFWRFNLFGAKVERVEGSIYHLDHYRGPNSSMNTNETRAGHQYWEWLKVLDKEQVCEHLGLDIHAINGRGYGGGWSADDAVKEHVFSLELAHAIWKYYDSATSFIDLGAGPGFYSAFMYARGWSGVAYDYTPMNDLELYPVSQADLTDEDAVWPTPADVVLCLEVGEHIPASKTGVFIANLKRAAESAKSMVLSWAPPGQTGFGHVNCLRNEQVIGLVSDASWVYDRAASEYLRSRCAGADWFANSLICFKRP